jgi:signal transduction histidine kinase
VHGLVFDGGVDQSRSILHRNAAGSRGLARSTAATSMNMTRLIGATLLAIAFMPLSGCSPSTTSDPAHPRIEFTRVPLIGADNPEKLTLIAGRALGARPGQQIVIYAKGQTTWWVQPFADRPFTKINADSEWSNSTHPGVEYAALLVGPDFHPPPTTSALPTEGVFAAATAKGETPFWRKWWFPIVCVMLSAVVIVGMHRLRLYQVSRQLNLRFEERLAERTRVAQELHDTLLQGVLSASMQLHVAVDQLPADSPALPAMSHVLELMGRVVQEGRNTLRGLRLSSDNSNDLKSSLLRIPEELGRNDVEFRVVEEGLSLPLRRAVLDDVYRVGREALVNAFRHSQASNIDVLLEYSANQLRLVVRDDGCGIDPKVLRFGKDGHWGLSGMRERAERIGASVKVLSRAGGGTEVELRLPSDIAFESQLPSPAP